ncbi:MAG TPA: ATP-binding cassette domain-containing protein [Dehalococcoidia bacterium]|nr:ATP-binding cassette domain-containing protein [Dehalococcoidia bacterium]
MTTADTGTVEYLKGVPIFAMCPEETLKEVAALLEPVHVTAGSIVFAEGDEGDGMYIVSSGHLRVVSDVASEKVIFAHLGPGEFFGEMALITGGPRSAGVIATTDAGLWRLRKPDFEVIVGRHPEISVEISRVLGERVRHGNLQRFENEAFTYVTLTAERPEITIGRLPENDVVLNDPQVAGIHARLRSMEGRWVIYDQDTESGTYVNRERVKVAELKDGDEILIGTNKVFLDGLTVKGFTGREGVRIDVSGLTKTLKDGRRILSNVSLSIYPGELVAIVGGSGAGKTTLLHALNGFSPGTEGSVTYNGVLLYENLDLFRPVLGYVPQDDIVHGELTVERTLYYGAKLRLPKDTRAEEIRERIEEVLESVGLEERRGTEVRRLSGGQRKRVSVALELLARPRALYLDEPTSGLDPALEGRMMALFRDLAEKGATVLVSTHVTQNLRMCDKVAVMAPGGHLVFFGSPTESLRHFGVPDFQGIYALLETEEQREHWANAFPDSPAYAVNVRDRLESWGAVVEAAPAAEKAVGGKGQRAGFLRQLYWLTVRYAEVLVRDVPNLALLLFQAPAIAGALLLMFKADVFAKTTPEGGDALRALMSLHTITASAIFLGASNAAREITKESAVYARERLVNLGVLPYVASKFLVLALLCFFQAAALVGIFAWPIDLPGNDSSLYPELFAAIFLTELAGLSMGLLVSAVSHNSDRAQAVVPLLIIPQLIFMGALVPLDKMLPPARVVSDLMISKWSLQLTGQMTDLGARFSAQFPPTFADAYREELDITAWVPWVVLCAFTVVFLTATLVVQKRKDVL